MLLLVCVGVGGWGCPISLSTLHIGTASCALMYTVPSSALATEDMTALMSCAMLSTNLLLLGFFASDDMKKTSGMTTSFWFVEIQCIAVDDQNHVACVIGEYSILMGCCVIEKIFNVHHGFLGWLCLCGCN